MSKRQAGSPDGADGGCSLSSHGPSSRDPLSLWQGLPSQMPQSLWAELGPE